jgi:hypothetical protein
MQRKLWISDQYIKTPVMYQRYTFIGRLLPEDLPILSRQEHVLPVVKEVYTDCREVATHHTVWAGADGAAEARVVTTLADGLVLFKRNVTDIHCTA